MCWKVYWCAVEDVVWVDEGAEEENDRCDKENGAGALGSMQWGDCECRYVAGQCICCDCVVGGELSLNQLAARP